VPHFKIYWLLCHRGIGWSDEEEEEEIINALHLKNHELNACDANDKSSLDEIDAVDESMQQQKPCKRIEK